MNNVMPIRYGRCVSLSRWLIGLVLFAVLSGIAQAALPEKTLELRLDPSARALKGEMRTTWPAGERVFRLLPGLEVKEARLGDERLEVTPLGAGRYRIAISDSEQTLSLRWGGTLPAPEDVENRVLLEGDNGFLPARGGWYPTFTGEGEFSLSVDAWAPGSHRLVATGSLEGEPVKEGRGYRVRYVHPRVSEVSLAYGSWRERTREVDGVTVRTLFPAALDAEYAETYLDHAAIYLTMFRERLGAYPYASFTMAASSAPVGLAFPGFTLLGEQVIPLPFIPQTSLAHELMHSWWGVGVRVDYASGNWAEALAAYMADYALDEQRGEGRETRRRWLQSLDAIPSAQDKPLTSFRGGGSRGVDQLVGYHHGAMLFHMLEWRIGATAFEAGARDFGEKHMFQVASWEDLQAAFSEAAQEDLSGYFDAWTTRSGRPALSLLDVNRRQDEPGGWHVDLTLEQQGTNAPWPLEVPLKIDTDEGTVQRVVTLDTLRQDFSVEIESRPQQVAVDPDYHLLRQLHEAPPTLRTLLLDPQTRLVVTRPSLESAGHALLNRTPELAETYSRDTPLLVIGGTNGVARWLREHNVPSPPQPMLRQGHARMWTVPGTRLAVISADDSQGLSNLVGSLRHHAHRGYLVQNSDGSVLQAGAWDFQEEALQVSLTD